MDIGALRQRVTLETPGAAVPDGDGGFTQAWASLSPGRVWAEITQATQRALERLVANTVIAQATHIVRMRYHSGVTTKTRLSWTDRSGVVHVSNVTDVSNTDERSIELVLLVAEIVP